MKRFIIQVVKYTLITVTVLVVLIGCTLLIVSKTSFTIRKDKSIIVIGDSHTQFAIDDAIFTHAINIAQGGTAYLYSYAKLKRFLDENEHINTVLLSFHYGILTTSIDDDWIFEDKQILNIFPLYFFLLDKEELSIFNGNISAIIAFMKIPVKNIRAVLKFLIKHTVSYKDLNIGGYQKSDRNKLQDDFVIHESNKNSDNIKEVYSLYQLNYLQKIINLCKKKNVELVLFNTPIYDPVKYGFEDKLLDYYNLYFKGVRYINYSDYPLPEFGYGDIGHLNFKGAEIFSRYLEDNFYEIFYKE
jgi:hypothetical protein